MKRLNILLAIKVVLACICLANFTAQNVAAQDFGITNRVTKQKRIATVSNRVATPRQATRVVYTERFITKETTKTIKPTGLSITVLPETQISLESIDTLKKVKLVDRAKSDSITFESLRPGKYRVIASLEGYEPLETDTNVVSQKITVIPIKLKPLTYSFAIKTNVPNGEVRFAPVTILGDENADGTLEVKERGGFCMAPIIDGKATINEMAEGAYILDVRSKDVEYQPETVVIKIPENIPVPTEDKPNENPSFAVNLENTQSTGVFNQILVKEAWTFTNPNWKLDSTGMKISGAGVALPKAKNFRFYKDFEMQSSVRILDNSTVGFVVRARDENNYYLIQLSGAAAKEPYLVSAWVVKDGKLSERVLANPIKFILEEDISKQKYFEVKIKAKGNIFEVFSVDSTGTQRPLGNAVFKDDAFPIGAVGIGGAENSRFETGRFTVCNEICK